MASQAQLQAQITAIDNQLRILRQELSTATAAGNSVRQQELFLTIFDLEREREQLLQLLANVTTANNPPNPQVPASPPPPPLPQPQQPVDDPSANQFVFDPVTDELVPANSARAQEILAEQNRVQQRAPAPVDVRGWRIEQNDGTGPGDIGTFYIVDLNGEIFRLNIATRAEAESALREAQGFEGGGVTVTPVVDPRNVTPEQQAAEQQQATLDALRAQAAINERRRQANQGDWRVRLRLAPNADYLYRADQPGILQPLKDSDGVIFPYTPKVDLSYRAMYDVASLTHANYNSYFYKNSLLDPVNITATFTAQSTSEANYLLAVIHFFRSVTKMFYGQDPLRGAPPPLVFFTGFGEYQFSEHPCLVHQFNYSLPSDVDYIRANSILDPGVNLQNRRSRSAVATTPLSYALKRLSTLGQGINPGAVPKPPPPPTLGQNSPTYVPTRIDISLILYPVQSRSQVSQQFSLVQYANGDLLKGGFW